MKEKVLKVLQSVNQLITDGANLFDEGILDSYGVMNIVMGLEDAFGIKIDLMDLDTKNFETVDAIVELVEKRSNN